MKCDLRRPRHQMEVALALLLIASRTVTIRLLPPCREVTVSDRGSIQNMLSGQFQFFRWDLLSIQQEERTHCTVM